MVNGPKTIRDSLNDLWRAHVDGIDISRIKFKLVCVHGEINAVKWAE